MKKLAAFSLWVYQRLIRLYPHDFRAEFQDELSEVFQSMLREAEQHGSAALFLTCLREFWDLPGGLFQAHLQALKGDRKMRQWLTSQPVQFSARCGAGFGISFLLFNLLSPILQHFYPSPNLEMPAAYALMFAVEAAFCLIFGLVMALAFGEIRRPQRFFLLAAIWIVFPSVMNFFIWLFVVHLHWLNEDWFQTEASSRLFNIAFFAITGAFLGLVLNPWPKDRRRTIQFILAGAIGLPLARMAHLPSTMMTDWNPAIRYGLYWGIVGLIIGAALGILSRWSAPPNQTPKLA